MSVKSILTTGPKPRDIRNQRFDRLVAISYVTPERWLCICDCGTSKVVIGSDLRRGKIRSCGCILRELKKTGDLRRTHGASNTPEYRTWSSMINRCNNPKTSYFHRYGGRGIAVCSRWRESFENFFVDMGTRPPGKTIDRIRVDGNYEPSNCRWATALEQAANTSVAVMLTARGKTQPTGVWAREVGISQACIRYRLSKGLSHEEAIFRPARPHKMH
jgi:hypothetical protein